MSGRTQIVTELKRALRASGHTYAHVAKKLDLSEASVKRLFSQQDLSLERIDAICELIGLGLIEILERARERMAPVAQLTLAQESEIVSDLRLLFMTWLVLIRTPFEEMVHSYRFTEREALRYLIRLDRLKVIELQPGNRVRLLVSRHFSWRAGGPVQKYINQRLLREFFASHFIEPSEEFFFHGGRVSAEALGRMKRTLQGAARECAEIIERDRSGSKDRFGAAFVLALRPWNYSGFRQFDRD
ncbi:MAG TPA: helix-turn-helix transcriptional regulator [Steroidobacteraceae bacterium]|nr:helix-turn-helix transcriptional regulator [Steroidobacteraceae bacterium]